MALALSELGLSPRVCPGVRAEMATLAADTDGLIASEQREKLAAFLAASDASSDWHPTQVIIATEANAEAGLAAELAARQGEGFRLVFSGHVPPGTPAASLLAAERARWLPWNVHPRLRDVLSLAETTGARYVIPAFTAWDGMTSLQQSLGERLCLERTIQI